MRSRYRVTKPDAPHFITSTIVECLPIFTSHGYCDILVDSLRFCREKKDLRIYGWVILPNHFHAIVSAPDLSIIVADIKKFTARRIVERLAAEKREWLLNQLRYYKATYKPGSYQIWQEGFHPQEIASDEMMLQKLEYLHNNPIRLGLVAAQEHWRYSSAHSWMPEVQPVLACDDWRG